ncbi:MAG: DUF547 domain-containing protein [candidate division Zixibacteria bacterium]|nr:DUF547 domain-containing protein [candidate division Zixibacteria bacterium]
MKRVIGIIIVGLLIVSCGGETQTKKNSNLNLQPIDHQWVDYASLLTDYVSEGLVDYKTMKADRARVDALISTIASADISEVSKDRQLTFYINSYNIITLRSIVDAYPVKSIKDIDGVWKKKKWTVSGREVTLNELENDIIREEFSEPRIHFALVCAAKGCPPLISVPYLGDILRQQLAKSGKQYVTNTKFNWIDTDNKTIGLSQLFEWYGEDFHEKYYIPATLLTLCQEDNASVNYILSHYPKDRQEALRAINFSVKYLKYDWSLNEK